MLLAFGPTQCPAGTYSAPLPNPTSSAGTRWKFTVGASSCTPCPAGYVSSVGGFECSLCPVGFVYQDYTCTDRKGIPCPPSSSACVHRSPPTCLHCPNDVCPAPAHVLAPAGAVHTTPTQRPTSQQQIINAPKYKPTVPPLKHVPKSPSFKPTSGVVRQPTSTPTAHPSLSAPPVPTAPAPVTVPTPPGHVSPDYSTSLYLLLLFLTL